MLVKFVSFDNGKKIFYLESIGVVPVGQLESLVSSFTLVINGFG